MLGARHICAALLAFACLSVTSADLNMNHICALVNDGLMIASNTACDAYYYCSGGQATLQNCNPGNYFSKEYQNCLPQDQVNCFVASQTPCLNAPVGTWAPVANSCSGFYYCGANGPQLSSCSNGQNFNPITQSCVYASSYPCSVAGEDGNGQSDTASGEESVTVTVNLCNFIRNGVYFGNSANCDGWNKCVNNALISGVCPAGYLYNPEKMECDLPSYVTCSQVTNDPYLSPNYCSVKSQQKPSSSCSSYLVCDGTYYQLVECPAGLFYDTVSQACVSRYNARNDCDRCDGTTDTFVNMYSPTNCTGYLYCLNGHEASYGFCPLGTNFDERFQGCVATGVPDYGCCNPLFYSNGSANAATASGGDETTDETTDASKTTEDIKTTTDEVKATTG